MNDPRIPVTLLTGFLGAGKTTLLNAILYHEKDQRIAVVVNEFGEAGLDHDLIETSSDDIILMSSGCLCCTVRGELADTISGLVNRREAGDFDFNRIVIETTGLADPGPILQTMLVEPALARSVRLDGVVTVADAANGSATLDAQFEAVSQVAMADLIIISKADLVDYDQIFSFESRLRALNANAKIVPIAKGNKITAKLWGLSGMRKDVSPADALAWVAPNQIAGGAARDPLANLSGLAPFKPEPSSFNAHDTRINTASIVLEEPLSDSTFDTWLNTLVANHSKNLLRVKGIVFLEDIDMPFVFHGVQQIFNPPVPVPDWPKDDHRSRIVVIARDISQSELQRSLNSLYPKASQHTEAST